MNYTMMRPILLGLSAAMASGLLFINLYNSIVDAPNWGADIPNSMIAARNYFDIANPGNFFRIFSPLNQVLALVAVILCWKNNRYIALASLAAAILVDLMTFGYFYPRNEIMFSNAIDENAVRIAWQEWSAMNWVRSGLCAVNATLAFIILVLSSTTKKACIMTYTYPHTINNGSGEEITFVNLVRSEHGDMLQVENSVQPGAGPPMHIHWLQDESLTVVRGKLGAQVVGQSATFHGPGETITFPKGVGHRFWNAGDDVLLCRGWVTPANNMEYFLTGIFESTKANGGHRPSVFDGAFLQLKYQSEFDMVDIPAFVKKVVFPIVVIAGKLLGKHRKFADAPQPAS